MRIWFETHATSVDNEAGVCSGWRDADLSPLGVRQSSELGERYARVHLDAVFCSDLQRSYRTAEIAFGDRLPIVRDRRLRECDYGDFTGYPTGIIDAEKRSRIDIPYPKGESYRAAIKRIDEFLDEIASVRYVAILIVGHRVTQYGLIERLEGGAIEEIVTAKRIWQPGWTFELRS